MLSSFPVPTIALVTLPSAVGILYLSEQEEIVEQEESAFTDLLKVSLMLFAVIACAEINFNCSTPMKLSELGEPIVFGVEAISTTVEATTTLYRIVH
ncbi:sulfatase [Leptospira ellinghausenii]|uniref:Sulfatase n=1 Tax=Leptospira ellinghausenii TaxID=1917822 RepID=A0A2P2D8B5_9LEPT|nr:sulfatase [Leptospira ellinghausenii]